MNAIYTILDALEPCNYTKNFPFTPKATQEHHLSPVRTSLCFAAPCFNVPGVLLSASLFLGQINQTMKDNGYKFLHPVVIGQSMQ